MRQAEMYVEHGYAAIFETYLAQGLGPFLEEFDPSIDGLWIAEVDGHRTGCVAIQHTADGAQLRWFFVEESFRGAGLGRDLLDVALAFCRDAGYDVVYLWTMSDLVAARHLYEQAGFRVEAETDAPWLESGRQQKWTLRLD